MNDMNTIVFVEDDPEVGSLIAAYLARHDIEVILEPRGDLAEEKILQVQPDLVLLDIMLPGKDGMTICRDLRGRWQGPIVLLTSLDSDMNHILALEMGACDYILKTTPPAVLLARLRLHLRQNEHSVQSKGIQAATITPHTTLRFGTLTIDPTNRSVLLGGEQISLSTADFELLWELATHAGQIMDRDALLKVICSHRTPGTTRHRSNVTGPISLVGWIVHNTLHRHVKSSTEQAYKHHPTPFHTFCVAVALPPPYNPSRS